MTRDAGREWSRRPGSVLGPAALLCGLLGACGGSTPSGPTTPAPAPSPEPAVGGFLHVLQSGTVITYVIDGATGRLRQSTTQAVGDAHTLAGEPLGRYLFAAFGPRGGPPYSDPSIVAYAPDPLSGSLTTLSEASSDPIWCKCCAAWGRSGGWYWLAASSTRVYGMWFTGTYHDTYHTYVTHVVGAGGQLGPAYQRDFGEWDPGEVAVDVDSAVFYKGTYEGTLTAHFVEADGRLTQMGTSRLCLAATLGEARPLAAARGFVFASSYVDDEDTVCSWESPRLAPRANLELRSTYAVAFAPRSGASSSSATTLVAMRMGTAAMRPYEVRLFALGDAGALEPLDTVAPGYPRQLLFHPSGRFLYASHAASPAASSGSLTVYSIDSLGHLAVVETVPDGGGAMAVTLPPARASAGPSTD